MPLALIPCMHGSCFPPPCAAEVVELVRGAFGSGRSRDPAPPPAIPRFTYVPHTEPRFQVSLVCIRPHVASLHTRGLYCTRVLFLTSSQLPACAGVCGQGGAEPAGLCVLQAGGWGAQRLQSQLTMPRVQACMPFLCPHEAGKGAVPGPKLLAPASPRRPWPWHLRSPATPWPPPSSILTTWRWVG